MVESMTREIGTWNAQAYEWLVQGALNQATAFYEQAIEVHPEECRHYWHLGLLQLLQNQEAEAQVTWFAGAAIVPDDGVEQATAELAMILGSEANRREAKEPETAWLIRQHLREFQPDNLENGLKLVTLSATLERLTAEELAALEVVPLLQQAQPGTVDLEPLHSALEAVVTKMEPDPLIAEFAAACLHQVDPLVGVNWMIMAAYHLTVLKDYRPIAAEILEHCLQVVPDHLEVLSALASCYQDMKRFEDGIRLAQRRAALVTEPAEQIYSNHLILRGLMLVRGGNAESQAQIQELQARLSALTLEQLADANEPQITRLLTSSFFPPYVCDDLRQNRAAQNNVMALCQQAFRFFFQEQATRYQAKHQQRPSIRPPRLKIGYLSRCLRTHSVGWLARWLIKYHDRDRFHLHGYFMSDEAHDPMYQWYVEQIETVCRAGVECGIASEEIADRIFQDGIDILIDLDSLTIDTSCKVLALKPAPIQATWLGWDASGMPAVDYFIADPYVLPDWADACYPEKIWRLPQTYLAIDGFEVGVPSLRRDQLNIPADAVVYLSAQRSFKYNPQTTELQMQILKAVPNSYFLLKGMAEYPAIQAGILSSAAVAGVDADRFRFLPEAPSEPVHRADLAIADVVLDTYPYNGATTTMETLWMGVPLVTRVGDQFASRNSYTMLVNAGIEEGIAWSDDAYIQWGIRLGTDATLRQQVHQKLLRSRQTAPLWNARRFTQEMERAYDQMWAAYAGA